MIIIKGADQPDMETATKDSWKTLPRPTEREHFSLDLVFSKAEVNRIKRGHMRVGEVRNVRICDVEVQTEIASDGERRPFCLVKNIRGKRGTGECRSWYEAYSAYQRILIRRDISEPKTCVEPLFRVHHRDMFNAILAKADLKFTPTEPKRRRDFVSLPNVRYAPKADVRPALCQDAATLGRAA